MLSINTDRTGSLTEVKVSSDDVFKSMPLSSAIEASFLNQGQSSDFLFSKDLMALSTTDLTMPELQKIPNGEFTVMHRAE